MKSIDDLFRGAPEQWSLPITPPQRLPYWQQAEYIICMQMNGKFAAHGLLWHYRVPTPTGWAYPSIYMGIGTSGNYAATERFENHKDNPFLPSKVFA